MTQLRGILKTILEIYLLMVDTQYGGYDKTSYGITMSESFLYSALLRVLGLRPG